DQHAALQFFRARDPQPTAPDHHLAAGSETIGKIGEEFHAQRALDPVGLEHASDPKIGLRFNRHTISTITRSSFLRAAARTPPPPPPSSAWSAASLPIPWAAARVRSRTRARCRRDALPSAARP